jgi:hypothetical protein
VNPNFKLIELGPAEFTSEYNFISKCKFGDLERSRSSGDDLEILLCGYGVYHEDELR